MELAGVLGLRLDVPTGDDGALAPLMDLLGEFQLAASADATARGLVQRLVEHRDELRASRRFELADRIRHRLHDLGVTLEDTAKGTHWSFR